MKLNKESSLPKSMMLVVAFVIIILSGCTSHRNNQSLVEEIQNLRAEIKSLRSETSQVREVVTKLHRQTIQPQQVTAPEQASYTVNIQNTDPILGDANAKLVIVEFTDYQCPFCKRHHDQTFSRLKKEYIDTGRAKYILKDYPLGFHEEAKQAAVAADCAGKQGLYWEMYDGLFENQRSLGAEVYQSLAEKIGADQKAFTACLKDDVMIKHVEQDISYASTLSVTGTPSFFIGTLDGNKVVNAKKLTGAQPYSSFATIIQSLSGK